MKTRLSTCVLLSATVAFAALTLVRAQAPPSFDVATIKLADPAAQGPLLNFPPPNRLSVTNFTLKMLIGQAYNAELGPGFQVTGGPSWIERDRYVILGQAQGMPTRAEMLVMLKTLLIDRFKLKTHTEMRDVDAYALVMARSDKKLGPKLTAWDGTCGGRAAPPAQPNATGPRCAAFFRPPGMVMRGVTMAVVANMLSAQITNLGRPVVDRTGLTGEYDFDLEVTWALPSATAAPNDAAAPSPFVALPEQLGLKLEPTKTTVKALVVDSAEKPTED